jgi:murein DD-endopeptidase MepM/ murein hydrolase activator NlpD
MATVTRYAHNSRLLGRVGDLVVPASAIAKAGSTGRSTGAHVHFRGLGTRRGGESAQVSGGRTRARRFGG